MIGRKRTVTGSSYNPFPGDQFIEVFHSGTFTITISAVYDWPDGHILYITDFTGNAGSLPITITAQSGNIAGGSSYVISEDRGFVTLVFNAFFNTWSKFGGTTTATEVNYLLAGNFTDTFAPPPVRFVAFTTNGVSHNVSGITSGTLPGRFIIIGNVNAAPGSLVNLTHQDGTSAAVNRFICPGGITKSLDAGDICNAVWDGSPNGRWRIY